jgi:hypothetical protein
LQAGGEVVSAIQTILQHRRDRLHMIFGLAIGCDIERWQHTLITNRS